jgi:hypothetical protein
MARRPTKRSSLLDTYYSTSHDSNYSENLNDYIESQMKEYENHLNNVQDKIENQYDKLMGSAYSQMKMKLSEQQKLDALRARIKSGAKPTRPSPPSGIPTQQYVDNIEEFTDQTHNISLTYGNGAVQMEYGTTQIVGMDKVEWWEYILLYGFSKAFKLSVEYNKVKHLINSPTVKNRTRSLKTLIVTLKPKSARGSVLYREKKLHMELPHKKVTKVEEYESEYFLYEDKFETFEIDQEQFYIALEKFLKESKVHQSLINQVIK